MEQTTSERSVRLDWHELGAAVHAAFTDRYGGVSTTPYAELNLGGGVGDERDAVRENRRRVAAAIGVPADAVTWMAQVHGADVTVVRERADSEPPQGDGVVTDRPGIALAVLVADCTPVLLADTEQGVIAAAHAGRPGFARGLVPATVARMAELGASPQRTVALVGPAVCAGCYEVPAAMRDEVVAASVPQAWARSRQGTPALDVPGGVVAQLAAAGVADVRRIPVCTRESAEHYSHRRDGVTGRFAGYVWMDRP